MNETEILALEKPKLKDPICVVGLPGIGNIGRVAVGYMIHQLKAKRFADLYSPYFFPFIMIHNEAVHVLRNEFYYFKNKKGRDLILIIGDSQTYDPKGHYEIAGKIVEFVKSLGCKEIITIGGLGTGKVPEKPKVYAVASDQEYVKYYKKFDLDFNVIGQVATIVGAAGLIVGMGKKSGMKGIVLLGETTGMPIITDPTAAEAVLIILKKMINLDIDLEKLDEKVKAMHEFLKKLEDIQKQAVEQLQKTKKPEDLKYIG
ncbi:MAG TPA: proteasome assembly chaperone family protein [archaeon]|nr:proteasome assembly chaperone family protein [archaeon]